MKEISPLVAILGFPIGVSLNHLRGSEEKHRFLTENILDVIWTADLEDNLTYVSQAIEKMIGFTPEEVMGMSGGRGCCQQPFMFSV